MEGLDGAEVGAKTLVTCGVGAEGLSTSVKKKRKRRRNGKGKLQRRGIRNGQRDLDCDPGSDERT